MSNETKQCPSCNAPVLLPMECGMPLIYEPFPCPSCNTLIEVDCNEVEGDDGDYYWKYWLEKSRVSLFQVVGAE